MAWRGYFRSSHGNQPDEHVVVLPPLSAPGRGEPLYQRLPASSRLMGGTARAKDERGYSYKGPGCPFIRGSDPGVMDYETVENGGKTAVVLGQKLEEGTYRTIKEQGLGGTGEEGTVMSYQMPVRTTPLALFPRPWALPWQGCWDQAVWVCYFWDACSTLCFTAMGCLTIRRMPFGRGGGSRAALLPMTLHLAASFSCDVMIIALSGYFSAVCLDLAYKG